MKKMISVGCPCCKNKRLFDIDIKTEGSINIKCCNCREIVEIRVHNKKVHAEKLIV